MQPFAALPVYVGGPIFVALFVGVAILAGLIFHRIVPKKVLEDHNDIAGFIFAVVGVVYAVLLGFLAIGVWERFEGAEVRAWDEANQLSVVYRGVDAFQSAPLIRKQLRRYVDLVIKDEWPKMSRGEASSEANSLLERIGYELRHIQASSPVQQVVLAQVLTNLHSIMIDRDDRLSMSATGINKFLWTILFLGAAGTMLFSYFFAFRHAGAQAAMTGTLAFSLAIVLYLIAAMDYPYRGNVSVDPAAFENAAKVFCNVGC